ncbi:MAG: RNA 2',3'-cyclic phosphodiesterase [Gammaproteobacteria bacterium]
MSGTRSSRRLFFAIWPQAKVREGLVRSRDLYCPHGGRWTPAEKLHVTLVFLGNVEVERIASVEASASRIDANAFEMRFDWLRAAPGRGMVWLAPRAVPQDLLDLVALLKSSLNDAGFETEKRAYRPHVTLIRKLREPFQAREIDAVHWPVESFALVESRQSEGSSRYLPTRIWRLRG